MADVLVKINQKINIAAIYIGLVISLIVPVIGLFIFGQGLLTGELQNLECYLLHFSANDFVWRIYNKFNIL